MKTFLFLIKGSSQLTASSCLSSKLTLFLVGRLLSSAALCWKIFVALIISAKVLLPFTFYSTCQSEAMGIRYGVLLFSISILMKGWKCWMYDFLTLQEWPLLSRFTVPAHFGVSAFPRSVEQWLWHLMFCFNVLSLIWCLVQTLLQWDMPS